MVSHRHICTFTILSWEGRYNPDKSGSEKDAQRNSTEEVGLWLKGEMLWRQDEGTVLGKGMVLK